MSLTIQACGSLARTMRKEILGYQHVREAARDWEKYSSDLLGDRDVRDYRQLPLEADPPRHTKFRMALNELFSPKSIRPHSASFEKLAADLITKAETKKNFEVLEDITLPYVIGCLAIIYRRPQDYEEWRSWGPDVWSAASYQKGESVQEAEEALRNRDFSISSNRSGETLQKYLDAVFDEAEQRIANGESGRDIWDFVAALEIDGERINRREMQGIANVLLAGGRDTVIKLLSGFVWHLISNPSDAQNLASDEDLIRPAIQEMARFLSPLPKMERVPKEFAVGSDLERDIDKYVLLSFVSANHDNNQWSNPEKIDLTRERNSHIAFGFGPHSCLGQNITEIETAAFLRQLLPRVSSWSFSSDPEIEWTKEVRQDQSTFDYLASFRKIEVSLRQ